MLEQGMQIIYVPTHTDGDIHHPDCEAGFVAHTTEIEGAIFCRYWSKYSPGELRTKANSELTPVNLLVVRNTVPQEQVEAAIKKYL
jgi:hypothetical protein